MPAAGAALPQWRLAMPDEIAAAICFLSSSDASYITGTVLSVDGGWTAFGDSGDASIAQP
jgi:NAD(P)-dependent dehydrogenase (short-subunit alcohol dehydrogenase family)